MSNIEIKRDHNGVLHLVVAGSFAQGAKVMNMQALGDELGAFVFVPLKHATFGEVENVVPFKSAA